MPPRIRTRQPGAFRPDIQGLRAVAVTLVVLCPAGVPLMAGGYVGVDVFFVISGFLITGWLLDRAATSTRVPFAGFYATRARRILPAAALTIVVTCIGSWYWQNSVRALATMHDAVWAAFFAANIHFAQVGADYFARDNPPSPLQHFWTLAAEAQFYLVRLLRLRPFQLTGDISYALYLWHWPVLVLAADRAGHPLSTWTNLVLIAFAYALSYVTYRVYENPLRHARSLRVPRLSLALWPASVMAVVLASTLVSSSLTAHREAVARLDVSANVSDSKGATLLPLPKRIERAV